jgi:hypothetical protein
MIGGPATETTGDAINVDVMDHRRIVIDAWLRRFGRECRRTKGHLRNDGRNYQSN